MFSCKICILVFECHKKKHDNMLIITLVYVSKLFEASFWWQARSSQGYFFIAVYTLTIKNDRRSKKRENLFILSSFHIALLFSSHLILFPTYRWNTSQSEIYETRVYKCDKSSSSECHVASSIDDDAYEVKNSLFVDKRKSVVIAWPIARLKRISYIAKRFGDGEKATW